MGVRRLLASASAAPLLLAVLTGCGGGDSSVADPPVAPGTSSPTDPPRQESPEHFIRRWAEAEKRMENSGKTADYAALSQGCLPCDSLMKDVRKYYAAGGYIRWGGLKVLSVKAVGRRPGGAMGYAVTTDSTPTKYQQSAHSSIKSLKGGVTRELLSLKKIDGHYSVVARARLPQ